MKTVKVRFTETYTVKAVDGATYQRGSVHELREDAARHFIARNIAVPFSESQVDLALETPIPDATSDREQTTNVDLLGLFEKARSEQGIVQQAQPDFMPELPIPARPAESEEAQEVEDLIALSRNPLVSCIMPTWNRRGFIPAAIDCWLKQTYPNKELIVVDDGDDRIKDLIPKNKRLRIRYVEVKRVSTGQKRNLCCEAARGEIICHFDDDDWSAPDRIADQVKRLQETGKPITGYATVLFWDTVKQEAKRYRANIGGYVCGTTLSYLKDHWRAHQFPDKQVASDNVFIYSAIKSIAGSQDETHMVARIHSCHHTSAKTGINGTVSKDLIPAGFWENERLRLS